MADKRVKMQDVDRKLDARPDRLDLRDREFSPSMASLEWQWPPDPQIRLLLPQYTKAGLILDQGSEGACTGFGLACVVNYLLWRVLIATAGQRKPKPEKVSPRMLYHLARFYDEWPGEDYTGSSCRGALKAWYKHGACLESLWPYRDAKGKERFVAPMPDWDTDAQQRRIGIYYRVNHKSVVDMQAAIREIGALYVSSDVHDGWGLPEQKSQVTGHASLPVIGPIKKENSLGGHAFALVGYNPTGFVVQNSWGTTWGNGGFAVLPYAQWVQYGTDAWVCALGVPAPSQSSKSAKPSKGACTAVVRNKSKVVIAQAGSLVFTGTAKAEPSLVSPAVRPWGAERAYQHTVVMGNDGRVISRIVTHENAAAGVQELVAAAPQAAKAKHLVIYAHGGLNSEEASIQRIATMAPYFDANGIYPVFLTWKTGPTESLADILEDELAKIPRPEGGISDVLDRVQEVATEVLDRTIEVLAEPVAKPIWSQMKQNAVAASDAGRGCTLIADALAALKQAMPEVKLHFVGHSAGSIILGQLLDLLPARKLQIDTCTLYAPACTVDFANQHYIAAVDRAVVAKKNLHIHLLADARELDDTVGPYKKSLLYLVSRALESCHKMPILGMQLSFMPKQNTQWNDDERAPLLAWQKFWGDSSNLYVIDERQISTGTRGPMIKASHGCFDNDAATLTQTIRRITGKALPQEIEALNY